MFIVRIQSNFFPLRNLETIFLFIWLFLPMPNSEDRVKSNRVLNILPKLKITKSFNRCLKGLYMDRTIESTE